MTKSFIITVDDSTSDADLKKIKDDVVSNGGKIGHEYSLIKGFSATLPDFHANTLKSHPSIKSVEEDQVVKTC